MAETMARREPAFLTEVRARKAAEVAARRVAVSLEELRRRAEPTTRSLKAALGGTRVRAILELKRRSPSEGALAPAAVPAEVLEAYRGAANAVSVLADAAFDGSLDDVREVRRRTDLPILCKDFVLGPDQVLEARLAGADAALVILSLVDDATAASCLREARRLGMDVLVEVHDAPELGRAKALGATLIGINNRNLESLAVDLRTTERLAGHAPDDCVLVSESGIRTPGDVRRLAPLVDAFLIGSAPMRAPDRFDAVRGLLGTRVKVCGLGHPEDARLARSLGARFGGLIFAEGSPRRVSLARAKEVAVAADGLPLVGVFRDASPGEIRRAQAELGLAAVQLHEAADALVDDVRRALPPEAEVWAALPVEGPRPAAADRVLYDQTRPHADGVRRTGGTGKRIPHAALATLDLDGCLLAGGIAPDNIEAAAQHGAWCLDACSSLETPGDTPRRKDPARMTALLDHARPANRRARLRGAP